MAIEMPSGLNEQQDTFCKLYAYSVNRGNGVLCYAEAYGIDLTEAGGYASAKTGAWRLLTNVDILSYIKSLYEGNVLNDEVVDNELAFVISQSADFGSKVAAIKEYNQLKGRIIKKIEQKTETSLNDITVDQFNQVLEAARKNAPVSGKSE